MIYHSKYSFYNDASFFTANKIVKISSFYLLTGKEIIIIELDDGSYIDLDREIVKRIHIQLDDYIIVLSDKFISYNLSINNKHIHLCNNAYFIKKEILHSTTFYIPFSNDSFMVENKCLHEYYE